MVSARTGWLIGWDGGLVRTALLQWLVKRAPRWASTADAMGGRSPCIQWLQSAVSYFKFLNDSSKCKDLGQRINMRVNTVKDLTIKGVLWSDPSRFSERDGCFRIEVGMLWRFSLTRALSCCEAAASRSRRKHLVRWNLGQEVWRNSVIWGQGLILTSEEWKRSQLMGKLRWFVDWRKSWHPLSSLWLTKMELNMMSQRWLLEKIAMVLDVMVLLFFARQKSIVQKKSWWLTSLDTHYMDMAHSRAIIQLSS